MLRYDTLSDRLVGQVQTLSGFQELAAEAVLFLRTAQVDRHPTTTAGREHYEIWEIKVGSRIVYSRPVNRELYIEEAPALSDACEAVFRLLSDLADNRGPSPEILRKHQRVIRNRTIQRVFYTIQQSYNVACDALVGPNTARKHVGLKFESLIGAAFAKLGIAHTHLTFTIVSGSQGEGEPYRAETDYVVGSGSEVTSRPELHNPRELVISVKSSSKDRMPKIFVDRLLMERFFQHPVKVVAIFHNDIQRLEPFRTSVTFVPNLFLIYTRYLKPLTGVYFVDPPPHIERPPWKPHLKRLQEFFVTDVWHLLQESPD